MKKYSITLTEAEREQLEAMLNKDKAAARKLTHARILLQADCAPGRPSWTDPQIADALHVDAKTVANLRQRFVLEGFELALNGHSTRNHRRRKVDGECEARIIATLCGPTPTGQGRWSLRLLADQVVEAEIIDGISHETVRQTLQANELKPWLQDEWCIPPEQSGEFVCQMEEILAVYRRPLSPKHPLVCVDEMPQQLISETRTPQPLQRSRARRYDYEYKREGVANIFMAFAPLVGQRFTRVTARRTYQDWAYFVRDLVDVAFPEAERLVLVVDNLNTHIGGALYETFPPAEASRILHKLELHYTPKHGSWLNMAEIELSVLRRQCLDRRIGTVRILTREVAAWTTARNTHATTVDWRFTTADARIKLKRLYPVFTAADAEARRPLDASQALAPLTPAAKRSTRRLRPAATHKSSTEATPSGRKRSRAAIHRSLTG